MFERTSGVPERENSKSSGKGLLSERNWNHSAGLCDAKMSSITGCPVAAARGGGEGRGTVYAACEGANSTPFEPQQCGRALPFVLRCVLRWGAVVICSEGTGLG